jgi:hypothetical protein
MSYNGNDKWECYIPEISIACRTYKEMKQKLLKKLESVYITQATGIYNTIEYNITDIKIKKEGE